MKKLFLLLLFSVGLWAQPGNPLVTFRNTDPAGSCSPQPLWYNYTLGKLWGCQAGTWALMSTGGVSPGTVTNVSGTANEISVANPTTTPVVSIAATFDISGKTSTAPIKKGTSLPATCNVGEFYDKTDATAGANLYSCTASNTWTVIGNQTASQYKTKTCVIAIGDPGTASPVLADDNDSPVACDNDTGVDWTITRVGCWADAGTPTVTPILTGGSGTSILTGTLS